MDLVVTRRRALSALATLAALALAPRVAHATPGQNDARALVYTSTAMGTVINLTFWTDDEPSAAAAADAAFTECRRLDGVMTTWTPDSEVSRINAAAGKKAIAVSDETFTVIARAIDVSKKSKGIFDITVGAYQGLWKFDQDMDGTLPDPAEVERRRKLVNWKDVILDAKHHTVKLRRKGMAITLGGIAKGYAVDRMVDLLHQKGFVDFIVQAGGDMYVAGNKSGKPWVVGIRDPRDKEATFAAAAVEDHSFSTSGDYERGFVKDGVRYHHILDPRTGRPAMATRSVTVKAKDAFTADAWSKVLFILGADEALPLVEALPDFDAVWVDHDNNVKMSSGLVGKLQIVKKPTPGI